LVDEEQYKTDCNQGDCNQKGEKIIGFKSRFHGSRPMLATVM